VIKKHKQLLKLFGISLLIATAFVISVNTGWGWFLSTLEPEVGNGAMLGSSITTIDGSDKISDSRTVINTNFTNLNNGKLEISDYISTTTDGLDEGLVNLYFTNTRVADYIDASSTMPVGDWNTAYSWGDHSLVGYFDNINDFTGTLTSSKWCIYDGSEIDCNVEPVVNTDTQDLSYDAGTDVISLTDGGSIDITEVDTDTTYTGGTNLTLAGTQFDVDDAFLVNSADDTTSFGITMGSATTSDSFRVEGKATFNGNVGIGTTSPLHKLSIEGDYFGLGNATTTGSLYIGDDLTVVGTASSTTGLFTQGELHIGTNGVIEGTLTLPALGVAAGTFLAVDANGLIIATTTPSGGTVTLAGQDYLTITAQEITAGEIEPDDLAASDFGEFTCDGTTCVLEATNTTLTTLANLVEVGALNAGSITSGFTSIDVGAGAIDGGVITADTNFAGDITGAVTGAASGNLLNSEADIGVGLTLTYSTTTGTMTIPQGATPEVTVIGQIALDSTDDQIIVFGASEKVIRTDERIFGFDMSSTSPRFISGGEQPIIPEKDGYTVTSYSCYVTGGTSVVLTPSGASQGDLDAITCATTITKDTTMTAGSIIAADEIVKMKIGTITGEVDSVTISVFGTWSRE